MSDTIFLAACIPVLIIFVFILLAARKCKIYELAKKIEDMEEKNLDYKNEILELKKNIAALNAQMLTNEQ